MTRRATHPSDNAALVADIGGTYARFAIADTARTTVSHAIKLAVADYRSLEAALAAYVEEVGTLPSRAAFAAAGPVNRSPVAITNSGWTFTVDGLKAVAGLTSLILINDYAAQALALPHLGPSDLHRIGAPTNTEGTKAIVGPGTGLGVGALAWSGMTPVALATEGGHVAFAPEDAGELAIVEKLAATRGRVSAERLLSGPGIVALYAALAGPNRPAVPTAPEITRRALAGDDPVAQEVLHRFAVWLGRFAGDAALMFGARGGVYLGGGIAPKILSFLDDGATRAAFDAKGRLSGYMQQIPLHVVLADDAGLRGAAAALREPSLRRA